MLVAVLIGLTSAVLTAVVTEIYCHRYLSHRAFRIQPFPARVMDLYFRVIVGTHPETWAAVHRVHHRHADTPLDPHSPVLRRPITVLAGNPFLFAVAKRRLGEQRPMVWWIWGLRVLLFAFYLSFFSPLQVLVMTIVHLVAYMGLGGLINTVGHLHGVKPYPEHPGYDLAWLAIPLMGHGYHNSHHAHPAAARTGRLDPIWPLLRVGAALGQIELTRERVKSV